VRERIGGVAGLPALAAAVAAGEQDPYAAADAILADLGLRP